MKIFISYTAEDSSIVELIYYKLRKDHTVFFYNKNLLVGHEFDEKIRNAIKDCDLMLFCVSPKSVSPPSYCLTELKFAEEKWPHPQKYVLGVMVRKTDLAIIPNYLKATTLFEPTGNLEAEVAAIVSNYNKKKQLKKRVILSMIAFILGATGLFLHNFFSFNAYEKSKESQEEILTSIFKEKDSTYNILVLPFNELCEAGIDIGLDIRNRLQNLKEQDKLDIKVHFYTDSIDYRNFTKKTADKIKNKNHAQLIIYGTSKTCGNQYCVNYISDTIVVQEKTNYEFMQLDVKTDNTGELYGEIDYIIYSMVGKTQYQNKNYLKAMSSFEKIKEQDRTSESYSYLGYLYYMEGEYGFSEKNYEKAIGLDSTFETNYNNLGVTYFAQKKYDLAEKNFRKALVIDSTYKTSYNNLGILYYNQKKYDLAEKNFEKAIALDSTYTSAHYYLGILQYTREKFELAIEKFNSVLEMDSTYSKVYYYLGLVYYARKKYELAINELKHAIHLNETDSLSLNVLRAISDIQNIDITELNPKKGKINSKGDDAKVIKPELYTAKEHKNSEKNADTEINLTTAIEKEPNNFQKYLDRGKFYSHWRQQENEKAIEDLSKAIELEPNNAESYAYRAFVYDQIDEKQKAATDYDKTIELDPENHQNYINRGQYYEGEMKFTKAEEDYTKAIKLAPDSAKVYMARGNFYESTFSNYKAAIKDYTKGIELKPPNVIVYYHLRASNYSAMGEVERAEDDYNKIIELESNSANLYLNRGNFYKGIKKYKKAEKDFIKAIELEPKITRYYIHRAALYQSIKEYDKAEKDYTKAIELELSNPSYIYKQRAEFYRKIGEKDKAVKDEAKFKNLLNKDITEQQAD